MPDTGCLFSPGVKVATKRVSGGSSRLGNGEGRGYSPFSQPSTLGGRWEFSLSHSSATGCSSQPALAISSRPVGTLKDELADLSQSVTSPRWGISPSKLSGIDNLASGASDAAWIISTTTKNLISHLEPLDLFYYIMKFLEDRKAQDFAVTSWHNLRLMKKYRIKRPMLFPPRNHLHRPHGATPAWMQVLLRRFNIDEVTFREEFQFGEMSRITLTAQFQIAEADETDTPFGALYKKCLRTVHTVSVAQFVSRPNVDVGFRPHRWFEVLCASKSLRVLDLSLCSLALPPLLVWVFPPNLEKIFFHPHLSITDQPVNHSIKDKQGMGAGVSEVRWAPVPEGLKVPWPESLIEIKFADSWQMHVSGFNLPDSLQTLAFGSGFHSPLGELKMPSSLTELSFGSSNPYTMPVDWYPAGLTSLEVFVSPANIDIITQLKSLVSLKLLWCDALTFRKVVFASFSHLDSLTVASFASKHQKTSITAKGPDQIQTLVYRLGRLHTQPKHRLDVVQRKRKSDQGDRFEANSDVAGEDPHAESLYRPFDKSVGSASALARPGPLASDAQPNQPDSRRPAKKVKTNETNE